MHPMVLRELANVVIKSLSSIFEKSWQPSEVPSDWRKLTIAPFLKRIIKRTLATTNQSALGLLQFSKSYSNLKS